MPPPTGRPEFIVGGERKPALSSGLTALTITESATGPFRCDAVFGNWGATGGTPGYLYFGRDVLDFGKELAVEWDGTRVFSGRIVALEGRFVDGTPEVAIRAEDRLVDFRMTRRSRSFDHATDAAIVERLCGDHGLTPDLDMQGPTHKVVVQLNESDLAFLLGRARATDASVLLDGTTLRVRRYAAGAAGVTLTYGATLHGFTATADLTNQRTTVATSGWDVSGKQVVDYGATDAAIAAELEGRSSGASVLHRAIGARVEYLRSPLARSAEEARSVAEAAFRAMGRRFVAGRGTAADLAIRLGTRLMLQGLGPLFSGRYHVTHSQQIFTNTSGHRTEFTAEAAGIGS
jgi:phage protein D